MTRLRRNDPDEDWLHEAMHESRAPRLRRNNPRITSVDIILEDEDDAAIAQALEQNQYVSHVRIWLHPGISSWDHLCRVLATRRNLELFQLIIDHRHLSMRAPVESTRPILQAIQQNASVRVVVFEGFYVAAEDLCSFLDNAHHVSELTLRCRLTGGADVAEAFRRNTNIATLKLRKVDSLLHTILEGLALNACLKNLVIEYDSLSEETRNSFRILLESTRTIEKLELMYIDLRRESFNPVAQGIINASSVTDITFRSCDFRLEGSFRLLNEIIERKQNLSSLVIDNCFFNPAQLLHFFQVLSLALRRRNSPLRHFGYKNLDFYNFPNESFSDFCEAVANSKLQSFSIGSVDASGHLTALANAVPSMKIQELAIQFSQHGYVRRDIIRQRLRNAIQNNYTLQSVKFQDFYFYGHDDAWVDETVESYMARNIRLAEWAKNPATVPKHLWKEAVTLATRAGPDTLFQVLRKIGPAVLPFGRRNKRKRVG